MSLPRAMPTEGKYVMLTESRFGIQNGIRDVYGMPQRMTAHAAHTTVESLQDILTGEHHCLPALIALGLLYTYILSWTSCRRVASMMARHQNSDAVSELDIKRLCSWNFSPPAAMSNSTECLIQSNPDIDGVGIRTSLYAQSTITIILFAISPDTTTYDSWWSTLVTALSLQLAAFSNHSNISLYHAVLVTWLSFPAIIMSFSFHSLYLREKAAPFILEVLTIVHICTFIAFALWVWATAPRFHCANLVHLIVFGRRVRVTGWIRYIVLTLLGCWTVGMVGVGIVAVLFFLSGFALFLKVFPFLRDLALWATDPVESEAPRLDRVLGGAAFSFGFLIFCVTMAELMIATHDVVPQDNGWGFGQIAAFILLMTPVFTLARVIRDDYVRKSSKPIEERPLAGLWRLIRQAVQRRKGDPDPENTVEMILSKDGDGDFSPVDSEGGVPLAVLRIISTVSEDILDNAGPDSGRSPGSRRISISAPAAMPPQGGLQDPPSCSVRPPRSPASYLPPAL